MPDLTRRGGRKYVNVHVGAAPNWFEQSVSLQSVGRVIAATLFRTITVGFRNRTIVVNQR